MIRRPSRLRLCSAAFLASILAAFSPASATDIGTVDGIPITGAEFDRLAKPYFEDVEARINRKLNADDIKLLERNVLHELIRERLWIADARRRGLAVAEDSVDARIKRNPNFRVDGRVDEARFRAYKHSPSSNYREIRSQVEQGLMLERYAAWLESRLAPREAEIRKAFAERTEQARLRYIWITPELMSLDPSASAAQIRAYFEGHPEEFETPDSVRITFVRVPFGAAPAANDSAREEAKREALGRATSLIADLAKSGSRAQARAPKDGSSESGWFRPGDPIRGLGRSDSLTAAILEAPAGAWRSRPVEVGPNWVVLRVDERRPARRLPFEDAVPIAKQRADGLVREAALESLSVAIYRGAPDRFRTARLTVSVVSRSLDSFRDDRPIGREEEERALERYRRIAGIPDTARAWSDSIRAQLPGAIRRDRALTRGLKALREAADRLRRGEPAPEVASRLGGRAITLSRVRGEPPTAPLLVEGALLDSLFSMRRGGVLGPRLGRDSLFVARVEDLDGSYLPPYAAVQEVARTQALAERGAAMEREARAHFDAHRDSYLTPRRWRFDYVHVRKAAPESVAVPADSIARYYAEHPAEFTEPGRARARHILIAHRPSEGQGARARALERARAALRRARSGEDFASLARELSDDRNSAVKGGELGEFTRGAMVKEFADPVFALEPGALSDVVESRYGFHVIKLEEKRPERLRPLSECTTEIRLFLGEALADSFAARAARNLAASAAASPGSFDSLASRAGGFTRGTPVGEGEPLPEIGPIREVERIFGGLTPGGVTPEPIALPRGYLVARLAQVVEPHQAEFAESKAQALHDVGYARRKAMADSVAARLRQAVVEGGALDSLVVTLGGLRTTRSFSRSGPIPDFNRDPALARDSTFLARVFASRPGLVLPPQESRLGTLFAVTDALARRPRGEYAKARPGLRREVLDQRFEEWTARLRARAAIRINRPGLYP